MPAIGLDSQLDLVLGGRSAKPLATHLDIRTVEDLLRHYPRRYVRRGELTRIAELQEDEPVTVMARVLEVTSRDFFDRKARRKRVRVEVIVADDEDERLLLTFFNQPRLRYVLKPGKVGLFAGKVGWFRGRRQLIRMMQDQYLVLDEGLSLLEGHWELRLHISAASGADSDENLGDLAMSIYTELRRFARAAVTFPNEGRRLVSAAFLVDRTTWVEFVERIEDFGTRHPELVFDVTGPWPAYSFLGGR